MIDAFREAMRGCGLEPPERVEPGRFYRFPGIGKRNGNKAGWCKLFDDGLGGSFGDYSNGLSESWQAEREQPLTEVERAAFRRQVAESRKQAEAQRLADQQQAATKAAAILSGAGGDPKDHPYALTKKVPFGPMVKRAPWAQRGWSDALLIPLFEESGTIVSVQAISANLSDKKDFLFGGKKKGCFHPLGKFRGATGRVLVGEGLATVAAAVAATGLPGVVAFDAGNLLHVAEIVRKLAPEAEIVVLADDDRKPDTDHNLGLEAATKAALAVGGAVAVPGMGKKADFWDLWNEQGADAVRQAIEAAQPAADQQGEAPEIEIQDWPTMAPAAFHGLAGDFVRLACRSSEADPAAVLATFMVRFGVEVGRAPTLYVGDSKHRAQLAAVVVGASSKARKGTSAKPVARLFKDMEWLATTSPGPFSSGEGIIYAVRDPMEKWDEKNQQMVVADPGVSDKRLFVMDEEFAGALASTKREGNTLSSVIRCAWDGSYLAPLTKNNKISATKHHIGWVSHITLDELHRKLCDSEAFNGFANRILWVCAKRSREVPMPCPMPENELIDIRARLEAVLIPTRGIEYLPITWSPAAHDAWCNRHYHQLTKDHPGLVGCVVNRGEAQVVRLAMIYCLLDGGTVIEEIHLNAALAFWAYCKQSAQFVFHGRQANPTAGIILEALQQEGRLTGVKLHALFGNNLSRTKINEAMSSLVASGQVVVEKVQQGKGRPATEYRFQKQSYELNEENELSPTDHGHEPINSFNSFNSLGAAEKPTATLPATGNTAEPINSFNSFNSLGSAEKPRWLDVQLNVPGGGLNPGQVEVEI